MTIERLTRASQIMEILHLHRQESQYPNALLYYLGNRAPKTLTAIGKIELLNEELLAIFSSIKCPGSVILKTYDIVQALRESGRAVISGFHSPVERECLTVLLRGTNPITICLARGIERMRIPRDYRKPLNDGRLLLVSPFSDTLSRPDAAMAATRNLIVAALAKEVFVSHAEIGSRTASLCDHVLDWGKGLLTVDHKTNQGLLALGAKPVSFPGLFKSIDGPPIFE